ncbi:DNA mismatch repair endonuclease MutL [Bacillus sp. 31A1R]|uniref:DNA mismatch repair protein MutL n=1 Tax=Robertmurraya mangrovi TaxID=3098077 RepID=A0ABU5J217_9BACI|nr:DNA mismatch repair endonuclease MutL [Bacillus sp. 31A1R]MDZ5473392.1 DNA mismatch repair endonuclease MutL [Bacillus sp. 31A1R]
MGKIIQLDDDLSNKIAAGEVVERPASVVKELVENAIDAASTIIEIEIEEAGLSKIRIIDNGDGIEEEDVLMAFQRHATSKIKDDKDLFRIRTLGFRGEALPSIASVSRLEMKTSTGDAGTRVVIAGGKVEIFEKASSRKGTDLTISDLFYNTPARLKYLKTVHTELGNITDVVNRLALSHPEISFRLVHNDRKLLHTTGNGDVRQVLAAIYGMNIVKNMIPIEEKTLDFTLKGWVSLPEITRASRNYISTMINGRFIKNYSLAKAISEGFHTLLPIGRYPIVLLNIEMDPILVDVNVHPSKMEVRLSKESELFELISGSIKAAFKTKQLIPSGVIPKKERPVIEQTSMELDHIAPPVSRVEYPPLQTMVKEEYPLLLSQEQHETIHPSVEYESSPDFEIEETYGLLNRGTIPPPVQEVPSLEEPTDAAIELEEEESRVPPLYPIGQMHGTYIFAQNDKGLYIIDQHAAQERIKYEYYKEKVGQVESELQELLVPLTIEYSTDECLKINEYKHELEKVGVFLETFGHNSYIIRSHPQWFPKGEEQQMIEDMIEQLLLMRKVDIKKLREEAAIMMSCKASIKANQFLRNDEIQALLDELRRTTDPFTCPHGRPIIIHYSAYEMEKMFKRVM